MSPCMTLALVAKVSGHWGARAIVGVSIQLTSLLLVCVCGKNDFCRSKEIHLSSTILLLSYISYHQARVPTKATLEFRREEHILDPATTENF